ncbi:MAG: recombinase family protein [Verrucomicrobia bacterium]|nr:recombinase family protein [Verrucomicrobiota bacterium]
MRSIQLSYGDKRQNIPGGAGMGQRCAIYVRVSTSHQTVENQLLELRSIAQRSGWTIVAELKDEGISGTKGRSERPAFDRLFQLIQRKEIDLVVSWSIDRLGRSLQHLIAFMTEVQAAGVDLYVHQQAINTATPAGRMVFGVFSALGEYERELIRERINAGLARARAEGKKLGRPTNVNDSVRTSVRLLREKGLSVHKIAKQLRIGVGTTSRILQSA